jgi:hypothetical protein
VKTDPTVIIALAFASMRASTQAFPTNSLTLWYDQPLNAAPFRDQSNGLKALIDAQSVTAAQLADAIANQTWGLPEDLVVPNEPETLPLTQADVAALNNYLAVQDQKWCRL